MKPYGRWTWQCNSCDTLMIEDEWRTIDDRRVLPLCFLCGAVVEEVLRVDWCPEGVLGILNEVAL